METEKYQQKIKEIFEIDKTGLLVPYLEAQRAGDKQEARRLILKYDGIMQEKFREVDRLFVKNFERLGMDYREFQKSLE